MHDPDVVAWEIIRPWPRFERMRYGPRWSLLRRRRPVPGSVVEAEAIVEGRDPYPWWKPRGWILLPVLLGFRLTFPTLVTVWHREPGGRDSGDVCPHYVRWQLPSGEWHHRVTRGWRYHVHHWRLQVHPWQGLRRRVLTRCAWCAGRHRRHDPVNMASAPGRRAAPWWRGEPGLYHHDCAAVACAHRACLCDVPDLKYGNWGPCGGCRRHRAHGTTHEQLQRLRILAAVPAGTRDPDAWATVRTLAALEHGQPIPPHRPAPPRWGLAALRFAVAQAAGWDWCVQHERPRWEGFDSCRVEHAEVPPAAVPAWCIICEQMHGPMGWANDCIPQELTQ